MTFRCESARHFVAVLEGHAAAAFLRDWRDAAAACPRLSEVRARKMLTCREVR